jgi:hypothetical protein
MVLATWTVAGSTPVILKVVLGVPEWGRNGQKSCADNQHYEFSTHFDSPYCYAKLARIQMTYAKQASVDEPVGVCRRYVTRSNRSSCAGGRFLTHSLRCGATDIVAGYAGWTPVQTGPLSMLGDP